VTAPAAKAPAIPYAGSTIIALPAEHFAAIQRTVALLFRVAHTRAYAELLGPAPDAVAAREPGNFGVFMGYDFHLTPEGPRPIEVNTNAGGALLNGLHTASLCDPVKLACLCSGLLAVERMEEEIVETYRAELAAARGPGARLAHVAIVDERPREQFLYREFELFAELFACAGIEARIADTSQLGRAPGGGVALPDGSAVDLVYLRDTDFRLESERAAALRDAYLAREVVVTPSPREWHLLADKRRLALFGSGAALRGLGVAAAEADLLSRVVPETLPLAELGLVEAWRTRRDWVFKPPDAFGSRAVYRGDKISRRKLDEIAACGGFLAQRRVEPGELMVETSEGPRLMKFDVRAYAYRGEVLLLGARVYQGQVTNLRSPGGGFSAICVARGAPDQASASGGSSSLV
jgi:hypothetical protein